MEARGGADPEWMTVVARLLGLVLGVVVGTVALRILWALMTHAL